uniref:Uncharacterized protein n=1 Tax=Vespula pensylvanica TaxID=30213 RepID=A0A834P7H2_VESPE|nr:hypothetical protein H0235_004427 [Vespula pensylvanica]
MMPLTVCSSQRRHHQQKETNGPLFLTAHPSSRGLELPTLQTNHVVPLKFFIVTTKCKVKLTPETNRMVKAHTDLLHSPDDDDDDDDKDDDDDDDDDDKDDDVDDNDDNDEEDDDDDDNKDELATGKRRASSRSSLQQHEYQRC